MKKHRKNEKNNETHWKNKEQSWHTLKQIMKTMTNIEKHNEQYWKKQWKPWTTLKNQWKIMKNIEKTMETNVKIIHRLILSWGPFEAHLRFRWGYFESPLRLLLTASLDLYINLLLNWFWKNLRVSLKTTKKTCEANLSKFH